jgi:hypothetical protein
MSFEGGPFAPWNQSSGNGSATFEGDEGDYSFRLVARDASGRTSEAAVLRGTIAFTGVVRFSVTGPGGMPLPAASVEVVGANQSQTGAGVLAFRLPEGSHEFVLRAPGYTERRVTANVTAGSTTDVGPFTLEPAAVASAGGGAGLLLGVLIAAAALGAAVLFVVRRPKRPERADEAPPKPGP